MERLLQGSGITLGPRSSGVKRPFTFASAAHI
jgi:hypothetical protein